VSPGETSRRRIRVVRRATADLAAQDAAAHVAAVARRAVAQRGSFALAVSGGRSPWRMLAELAEHEMPWASTQVFQVDERIGPRDDPQRNLTGLLAALPAGCPAEIIPMPVEDADLAAGCATYARALPPRLDLVHLGLGADGHTASLVPGDPVLEVAEPGVAVTGIYRGRRRMTLTFLRIARARQVLWLVTGEEKRDALDRLLVGDRSIPAGRVDNPDQVLFTDIPG
jgi:6-phosphogluconolactonase